ncbi:hypothetical protein [uncultured Clostridium sp.]|uniref:hypothetical protein n=1 Tax=uncultured Clostridium sp. TaxID=59620 RepID=UPI0028E26F2C|nr:hypothetical protein [uncultured Clostridium sp.]
MEKYTVEQMSEIRWFYSFTDVNDKGEKLIIELTKCTDSSLPKSLPKLWRKGGYIDRVLETYWSIQTYVEDTEGNCFGRYNPQHKLNEAGRAVINFDWMFEATEENRKKLINEVYQLFSSAKGETATEEKKRKIKEYAIKNNIFIYKTIPQGWDKLKYPCCLTAPIGTVWISNKELFKSANRKQAILLAD